MIYLYVKQHSITGLKYFGKTKSRNPFTYLGSGTYWSNHYKKHGKEHIQTIELYGFDSQKLCTQFALRFSKDNNIVESKEWANLCEEDGMTGGKRNMSQLNYSGKNNPFFGKKHTEKTRAIFRKKNSRPGIKNGMYNKVHSEKSRSKMSNSHKGISLSTDHKKALSESKVGKFTRGKNSFAKIVYYQGIKYECVKDFCEKLNVTRYAASKMYTT